MAHGFHACNRFADATRRYAAGGMLQAFRDRTDMLLSSRCRVIPGQHKNYLIASLEDV